MFLRHEIRRSTHVQACKRGDCSGLLNSGQPLLLILVTHSTCFAQPGKHAIETRNQQESELSHIHHPAAIYTASLAYEQHSDDKIHHFTEINQK